MADTPISPSPDSNEPSGASFSSSQGVDLGTVTISEVYKDLLTINASPENNQGLTDSLKNLRDGAGFSLPLKVSKTAVEVEGDLYVDDLHIGNTINLDNINQFLLQTPNSVTGTVFKIKKGSDAIFGVDSDGSVNCKSLDLNETTENSVSSPSEGQMIWDGTQLKIYM